MTRGRIAMGLMGLLLAVCAATLVVPARWLIALLPSSSVQLVGAQGTLWSGQALLAVGQPGYQRTLLQPLRWQVGFTAGPNLSVEHPWLSAPVVMRPVWGGLAVSGQSLRMPAALLGTLHASLAAANPGGVLSLSWPGLLIGPASPAPGSSLLHAQWQQASSALSPVKPLGSYRLTITRSPAGSVDYATLALSTEHGPLMIQGEGSVRSNGRTRFNASIQVQAQATETTRNALADLLSTLGTPVNGKVNLRTP